MFQIQEIDNVTLAFPAEVLSLMPKYEDIPKEFKNFRGKWNDVQATWFYRGLKNAKWTPKQGIDTQKALRHLGAIQGSFEPKHEHKAAAVAFLMSQWFDNVTYEEAKP